jgi:hypothetical protein
VIDLDQLPKIVLPAVTDADSLSITEGILTSKTKGGKKKSRKSFRACMWEDTYMLGYAESRDRKTSLMNKDPPPWIRNLTGGPMSIPGKPGMWYPTVADQIRMVFMPAYHAREEEKSQARARAIVRMSRGTNLLCCGFLDLEFL